MTPGHRDLRSASRNVRVLSETIGERNLYCPTALADAADYIEQQWQAMEYEVVRQTYELQDCRCSNLEVTRPGRHRPEEILLIGAHYDSVFGSPGANDNGSGVAALLEMARHLTNVEVETRNTPKPGEEPTGKTITYGANISPDTGIPALESARFSGKTALM